MILACNSGAAWVWFIQVKDAAPLSPRTLPCAVPGDSDGLVWGAQTAESSQTPWKNTLSQQFTACKVCWHQHCWQAGPPPGMCDCSRSHCWEARLYMCICLDKMGFGGDAACPVSGCLFPPLHCPPLLLRILPTQLLCELDQDTNVRFKKEQQKTCTWQGLFLTWSHHWSDLHCRCACLYPHSSGIDRESSQGQGFGQDLFKLVLLLQITVIQLWIKTRDK